jgi:hypothetical protein
MHEHLVRASSIHVAHREPQPSQSDIPTQSTIATINWQAPLQRVNIGGFSVIYRLAPSLIAKVGLVEQEEVQAQKYMAKLGVALPVLDYNPIVKVSADISRDRCSEHGVRPVEANNKSVVTNKRKI